MVMLQSLGLLLIFLFSFSFLLVLCSSIAFVCSALSVSSLKRAARPHNVGANLICPTAAAAAAAAEKHCAATVVAIPMLRQ